MYGYIYKTTNLIDGLIYIGQKHSNKFLGNAYLGSGKLIRRAIKKYGKENFTVELLEEISCKEDMDAREIFWIAFYNSTDHTIGYNISEGGFVNRTMRGENNPFYGRHHSEESKKKVSESKKGNIPWNKGKTKKDDERIALYAKNLTGVGRSNTKGTIWIHFNGSSKMVQPEQLQSYLQEGWVVGREGTCNFHHNSYASGKIRVNNGVTEKLVDPIDFPQLSLEGWQKGRLPFKTKKKEKSDA